VVCVVVVDRFPDAVASCVRIHIACAFCVGSGMYAARVRPERPERLVRQDVACASGRTFFFLMSLFRKFSTLPPTPEQPLNAYFAELLDITTELAGSEEAVSDVVFKNHIYTTLPAAYAVTIEILQSRARVTVQEVMDALNKCETNRSMKTKPDATSEVLYTQQEGRGGRGGYQGRYQGNERSPKGWCDWC